jgi:hypothetical protein
MKLATRFPLGKVVATSGAIQVLKTAGRTLHACCGNTHMEIGEAFICSMRLQTRWLSGAECEP